MRLKLTAIASAVLAPMLGLTCANVASATTLPDTVDALGQGTISPGIPELGCASSAPHTTFDLVGFILGPDAQLATFHFVGDSNSVCATFTSDSGHGTLTGSAVSATNGITYSRTGTVETIGGSVVLQSNGRSYDLTLVCAPVPTGAHPTTSIAMHCQGTLSPQ